jgi:dTDP-4-dehydrorhamnose reductase
MARILLLGSSGILGSEVLRILKDENFDYTAPKSSDLDITDAATLAEFIGGCNPDWIINCAAWTDVDGAEDSFSQASELNELAVGSIASAALATSCNVIHISTDYVFDGLSQLPYEESAETNPINEYGTSKLLGERALIEHLPNNSYVIRTSWLYGVRGKNFVKTMAAKALRGEVVKVVDDQVGSPTNSRDLAHGIISIITHKPATGIYHYSNSGSCSWFELAQSIFAKVGGDVNLVQPINSPSLNQKARRPNFSLLNKSKWESAGLSEIKEWDASLAEILPEILTELKISEAL